MMRSYAGFVITSMFIAGATATLCGDQCQPYSMLSQNCPSRAWASVYNEHCRPCLYDCYQCCCDSGYECDGACCVPYEAPFCCDVAVGGPRSCVGSCEDGQAGACWCGSDYPCGCPDGSYCIVSFGEDSDCSTPSPPSPPPHFDIPTFIEFGIVACVAVIGVVVLAVLVARRCRSRAPASADPLLDQHGAGDAGQDSLVPAEAPPPTTSLTQPALGVGVRVTVRELVGRPELNGHGGLITSWDDEKERFAVKLDGSGDTLLLRRANLHVEPQAFTPPDTA